MKKKAAKAVKNTYKTAKKVTKTVAKNTVKAVVTEVAMRNPFVAKEIASVSAVLKAGKEGKNLMYTSSVYGSASALFGISGSFGYSVSSNGDIGIVVTGSTGGGALIGLSAGHSMSFSNARSISEKKVYSRNYGAGFAAEGIAVYGERNEYLNKDLTTVNNTGYTAKVGVGAQWSADVNMAVTKTLLKGNIY